MVGHLLASPTCLGSGLVGLSLNLSDMENRVLGREKKGRARLAKVCKFLVNLLYSVGDSQTPITLTRVHQAVDGQLSVGLGDKGRS